MSHVTCQVSCVTCHMSHVMCQVLHVICHISHNFYFFFRQSDAAYWWRVCYQRGLPPLISQITTFRIWLLCSIGGLELLKILSRKQQQYCLLKPPSDTIWGASCSLIRKRNALQLIWIFDRDVCPIKLMRLF